MCIQKTLLLSAVRFDKYNMYYIHTISPIAYSSTSSNSARLGHCDNGGSSEYIDWFLGKILILIASSSVGAGTGSSVSIITVICCCCICGCIISCCKDDTSNRRRVESVSPTPFLPPRSHTPPPPPPRFRPTSPVHYPLPYSPPPPPRGLCQQLCQSLDKLCRCCQPSYYNQERPPLPHVQTAVYPIQYTPVYPLSPPRHTMASTVTYAYPPQDFVMPGQPMLPMNTAAGTPPSNTAFLVRPQEPPPRYSDICNATETSL